jgi:hypothetical protein
VPRGREYVGGALRPLQAQAIAPFFSSTKDTKNTKKLIIIRVLRVLRGYSLKMIYFGVALEARALAELFLNQVEGR